MSSSVSEPSQHPHLDHLFKIGVLLSRATSKRLPAPARAEAQTELLRYRDEGLIIQNSKESTMATPARKKGRVFQGQGIIFAVIDDRERIPNGRRTTVDIITDGIEAALDAGHETSEDIARYLTTSAFQHISDKRVRYNSVLKAGDTVGAQITRKLHNAYNDLEELADEEPDAKKKAEIRAEARGFAEALNVVLSPFSCEDPADPRLVDWNEVDRITEAYIKEQRLVRRDRKGNPQ